MPIFCSNSLNTQNDLLLKNLMDFYKDHENLQKMMHIINGETQISLRIVDWFVTNYAKKYYTVYGLPDQRNAKDVQRFKVYNDYKLKLKAYSKRRFDPFCRWERISVPYDNEKTMETTIGQLNFFKWAIENQIIDYIEKNYAAIETDMNHRNSTSKHRTSTDSETSASSVSTDTSDKSFDKTNNTKTRKKREELSVFACKCIKKEDIRIVVKFS
jgi:hypothetical protein